MCRGYAWRMEQPAQMLTYYRQDTGYTHAGYIWAGRCVKSGEVHFGSEIKYMWVSYYRPVVFMH